MQLRNVAEIISIGLFIAYSFILKLHCIEGMEINMNILIVEDDNLQAEALKMIISEYNSSWNFFIANDTIIATSLFTNNTIDIFFLDIEFTKEPETDGLILAESIRANPL